MEVIWHSAVLIYIIIMMANWHSLALRKAVAYLPIVLKDNVECSVIFLVMNCSLLWGLLLAIAIKIYT